MRFHQACEFGFALALLARTGRYARQAGTYGAAFKNVFP